MFEYTGRFCLDEALISEISHFFIPKWFKYICFSRSRADTASDNSSSNSLLNEELQRKIRENERLHTELSQIKQETDNQIMLVSRHA